MYNILLNKCLLCTTQNNPGPENSWTRNILRGKWFQKKKEKKKDKLVGPRLAHRGQKVILFPRQL